MKRIILLTLCSYHVLCAEMIGGFAPFSSGNQWTYRWSYDLNMGTYRSVEIGEIRLSVSEIWAKGDSTFVSVARSDSGRCRTTTWDKSTGGMYVIVSDDTLPIQRAFIELYLLHGESIYHYDTLTHAWRRQDDPAMRREIPFFAYASIPGDSLTRVLFLGDTVYQRKETFGPSGSSYGGETTLLQKWGLFSFRQYPASYPERVFTVDLTSFNGIKVSPKDLELLTTNCAYEKRPIHSPRVSNNKLPRGYRTFMLDGRLMPPDRADTPGPGNKRTFVWLKEIGR